MQVCLSGVHMVASRKDITELGYHAIVQLYFNSSC